jgi:hypothetical protein
MARSEAALVRAGPSLSAIDPEIKREVRRIAEEVVETLGPDPDLDEFLERMDERSDDIVKRFADVPWEGFGGLTENQVVELLSRDWADPTGPMVLNRRLPLTRVSGSILLEDARAILLYAQETSGIAATQAGNMSTAAVRDLLLRINPESPVLKIEDGRRGPRERDSPRLHVGRVLLELVGALRLERKRFTVTRLGRRLSRESEAGELFARLFEHHFTTLNLAYLGGPEWFHLQEQTPYTLYRLWSLPDEWRTAEELLAEAVLPAALESAPRSEFPDLSGLVLEHQILRTLLKFGVLEARAGDSGPSGDPHGTTLYRPAPLLREFVTFTL